MSGIYVPSQSALDWQRLLADPVKHWRDEHSAKMLAERWEAAKQLPGRLPREIADLMNTIGPQPELLVGLPEHKVSLPGSARGASQNDLFALIRVGASVAAVAVEGKVEESFGEPLAQWLVNASPGKLQRLSFLCEVLGLPEQLPGHVYYQLLHRTASAVIEARRFNSEAACMIVHSFSRTNTCFDAFEQFLALFGSACAPGRLVQISSKRSLPIFVGWACGLGA